MLEALLCSEMQRSLAQTSDTLHPITSVETAAEIAAFFTEAISLYPKSPGTPTRDIDWDWRDGHRFHRLATALNRRANWLTKN